jgi:hypothetical protein
MPQRLTLEDLIKIMQEAIDRGERSIVLNVFKSTSPGDCEGRSSRLDFVSFDSRFAAVSDIVAWRMGYNAPITEKEIQNKIEELERNTVCIHLGVENGELDGKEMQRKKRELERESQISKLEAQLAELKKQR